QRTGAVTGDSFGHSLERAGHGGEVGRHLAGPAWIASRDRCSEPSEPLLLRRSYTASQQVVDRRAQARARLADVQARQVEAEDPRLPGKPLERAACDAA